MANGKKVLVAEDDPDIRNLIVYSLQFAGFHVIEAINGVEALTMAQAENPDIVLLDVRMPKMSGYEVCEELKSQAPTQSIPVVFLSARGQEAEIKYGLELGAEEYIIKPFAPDELQRRVTAILERKERGKGSQQPRGARGLVNG
jgi:DNA-binding response OmpR family regulator